MKGRYKAGSLQSRLSFFTLPASMEHRKFYALFSLLATLGMIVATVVTDAFWIVLCVVGLVLFCMGAAIFTWIRHKRDNEN